MAVLDAVGSVAALRDLDLVQVTGRVRAVTGPCVRATIPGVRTGEVVEIDRAHGTLRAEVVGFTEEDALLLAYDHTEGVGPDDRVRPTGQPFSIRCSSALLGRVLDGAGNPIDGEAPVHAPTWPVRRNPPPPLERRPIDRPLSVGVRAIDALTTVGYGQRLGIFAGSGVGKSALLGQIMRGASADRIVLALIGERGRELREFVESVLDETTRQRSVVVCATSDAPALLRLRSAYVATSIAEWFRDQGEDVLLIMDSLTRFARAGRDVGLAVGEPPVRRGYPASVFAALPDLLERAGCAQAGSITAFYTVLAEGDDLDEPIADEVRGLLDGHIVLDRALAARGHYPAIDIPQSLSRVMTSITSEPHRNAAHRLRALVAEEEAQRDLVAMGGYQPGRNPLLDEALRHAERIRAFLRQTRSELSSLSEAERALRELFR